MESIRIVNPERAREGAPLYGLIIKCKTHGVIGALRRYPTEASAELRAENKEEVLANLRQSIQGRHQMDGCDGPFTETEV